MTSRLLISFLLISGLATEVTAQSTPALPKAEVAAAYQLTRLSSGGASATAPKGWYLDVARNLNPRLSVIGAVGGNYKTVLGESIRIHGIAGGLRMSQRKDPRMVPFGQALFGLAPATGFGRTATHPAIDFGGGVTIWHWPTLGIRLGADLMHAFSSGDTETDTAADVNVFRITIGVVGMPFGKF